MINAAQRLIEAAQWLDESADAQERMVYGNH